MRSPNEGSTREDAQIDMCLKDLRAVEDLEEVELRYLYLLVQEKIGAIEDPQDQGKYQALLTKISERLQ